MKHQSKAFLKFLKIAISLALIYWVFQKVSFTNIWEVLKKAKVVYIILATLTLIISQVISSKRLLIYFHNLDFKLTSKSNLKLYFVGMFYNFFIPGGIGGDAYKIYLLNKQFNWSGKQLTKAVFVDRLSGLLAILVWILLLSFPLKFTIQYQLYYVIPVLLISGVLLSKLILKKMFPSFNELFYKSLVYSLFIQGFQLICVFCIIKALGLNDFYVEYLILFLVSAILSIISFAGIGVREFIFLKASQIFNFNTEISVSIGLIFTLLSFVIALVGIYFEFFNKKLAVEN